LTWRALEVSSESEYVFDANSRSDWFYYNWSELSFSPVDWLRVGLAGQRTRAYASERDIQRGFLVGFSTPHVDVTAYMFNPDDENPTYVLSASLNFQLPRVRK